MSTDELHERIYAPYVAYDPVKHGAAQRLAKETAAAA